MTSTLRVTASNKFTLFDLKTRQIAVRNAFWKGSFVRTAAIHAQISQRLQSIRHSDILTTSRYIDVNSKKLSEAAQRFKHWPLHITA
jgi:hypothetical protein